MNMFAAEYLAMEAHKGQLRRDGITPYIEHPKAVASFFEQDTKEWETALLHDVFEENKNIRRQDIIGRGISARVADVVALLTHEPNQSYLEYIQALSSDPIARKVKLADIFTNLADSPTDRQKEKYKKALAILLNY